MSDRIPVTAVQISQQTGIREDEIFRAVDDGRIPFHRGPDQEVLFYLDDCAEILLTVRGKGTSVSPSGMSQLAGASVAEILRSAASGLISSVTDTWGQVWFREVDAGDVCQTIRGTPLPPTTTRATQPGGRDVVYRPMQLNR